ncbi:hypothetical protein TNCV_916011 [Trichonephila clavipes]|nr:hypothetical protein TNCV_916011 [Trichonephila clavipes]
MQKVVAGTYPLYMIVGSKGQGRALPQKYRVPEGHLAQLREKTPVFSVRLPSIVLRQRQKFARCAVGTTVTQRTVRNRLLLRTAPSQVPCSVYPPDSKPLSFMMSVVSSQGSLEDGDMLSFLMKVDSALVPMMIVFW